MVAVCSNSPNDCSNLEFKNCPTEWSYICCCVVCSHLSTCSKVCKLAKDILDKRDYK